MAIEDLLEQAVNLIDNPEVEDYLKITLGMYAGKLLVELSGYWKRRESNLLQISGKRNAFNYRRAINTMNLLPFPLDIIYSLRFITADDIEN